MIFVVVCGYKCDSTFGRCIDSLKMQSYTVFDEIVSLDSVDNRKYLVRNTADTLDGLAAKDDDIVVLVDADDFMCDEDALQIIHDIYGSDPNLLLTYGSYVNLSNQKRGKFCGEYEIGESFRTSDWRGTHLKTFKYKLWKALPKEQLKFDNGEWFKCCADRAMMIPMMEIAGFDRIRYIDMLLYCYNDTNPNSVWKTNKILSIKTRDFISQREPLKRIEI